MSNLISVDTAVLVAGVSKRTLWRWLGSGAIQHRGLDQRGRAMLAYAEIKSKLCVTFEDQDTDLLVSADQGCSDAQNDIGILCLEQERADIAIHWFKLAADQGHADAMHFLSKMYHHGNNIERSDNTALLWRVKAAEAGHVIAIAQMVRS